MKIYNKETYENRFKYFEKLRKFVEKHESACDPWHNPYRNLRVLLHHPGEGDGMNNLVRLLFWNWSLFAYNVSLTSL